MRLQPLSWQAPQRRSTARYTAHPPRAGQPAAPPAPSQLAGATTRSSHETLEHVDLAQLVLAAAWPCSARSVASCCLWIMLVHASGASWNPGSLAGGWHMTSRIQHHQEGHKYGCGGHLLLHWDSPAESRRRRPAHCTGRRPRRSAAAAASLPPSPSAALRRRPPRSFPRRAVAPPAPETDRTKTGLALDGTAVVECCWISRGSCSAPRGRRQQQQLRRRQREHPALQAGCQHVPGPVTGLH